MNAARTIPAKDLPLETLKAGKEQADAEDKAVNEAAGNSIKDSEAGGSSEEREEQSTASDSDPANGDIRPIDFERSHGDENEIQPSPVQERPGRDIRFGDLPHPRKHERQNSEVNPYENAIDDTEDGLDRRTNTFENTQSEPHKSRFLRRHTSSKLMRPATFERILSNTFRRKRRDGSPTSRRSSQSNMTLPYFTFTPTIGRNSVFSPLNVN
jgi:hypothetical protein